MQPDGVVRIVPVYHLQIAQEVVVGIPDHFLNTLRGAAEDTDYDIDRGYYHFRGVKKEVWDWFQFNAGRYYEEWSRHAERFGDVERRVRRRDAVIFGPGGIAEPGRPEDAIYEVTTVRRRNRFALPEERLADWERALLYGEDVDDILPSRRGSDGNRIV